MAGLPADAHVHSEFSWDTGGPDSVAAGRMLQTCEQAVRLGLETVAFTEHLDLDSWLIHPEDVKDSQSDLVVDGQLHPRRFEADRYLAEIDRCRHRFSDLTILTGVEYGQPHRSDDRVADVVNLAGLDRINGSLHTIAFDGGFAGPSTAYRHWPADRVMSAYLAEIPVMVEGSANFEVFTHIDYAARYWPVGTAGRFDPIRFEDDFRTAMRAIAASGRALELNTRRLEEWIPRWWAESGGRAVTFGSDAHVPAALAHGFDDAARMARAHGFEPGRDHRDPWVR